MKENLTVVCFLFLLTMSVNSFAVGALRLYCFELISDSSLVKPSTPSTKRHHFFSKSDRKSKVNSSYSTDTSVAVVKSDTSENKVILHHTNISKSSITKENTELDSTIRLSFDSIKENNKVNTTKLSKDSLRKEVMNADTLLKSNLNTIKVENKKRLNNTSDSLKNRISNLDTTLINAKDDFAREVFSIDSTKKDKLIAQKKELLLKKKEKLISAKLKPDKNYFERTTGNINLGYDYGVVPFIVGGKTPSGFVRTEGNVGLELVKIPVIFNYYYASVKNIAGLNNFFRLSLDVPKYKANVMNKLNEEERS